MKRVFPLLLAVACLRPSEDHVAFDREVGRGDAEGTVLTVDGGAAAVRSLDADAATLWAAAPVLRLDLTPGQVPFRLEVRNVLADTELALEGERIEREPAELPTRGVWTIERAGAIRIAPPDDGDRSTHRVAVLSDIQSAIGEVQDIFARMNEDPAIRFVVSTGDLSDNGSFEELERVQLELEALDVPLFSTVGNHEVPGPDAWHTLYGPFSTYFEYRGVAYALVDSSNATIDPSELERLRPWLEAHASDAHLFLTHVPLLDAAGLRAGAFRSRNEAARLLNLLAEAEVDALFFGHVHSYYAYELAGVPTYISGGGGAIEERLDGISRHYLTVDLSADGGIESVGLVRID